MGIKFGEVDTAQILQNEFSIMVLEKVVDTLAHAAGTPTIDIDGIRRKVLAELQKKYPKSGIEYKG